MDSAPAGQPPANLSAEMGLLGSMLLDPSRVDEVRPIVAAEDFWRDAHQRIARAVFALRDRGCPVDFQTVWDELDRAGETRSIGDDGYLMELVERTPHACNATSYARIVREKAVRRRLLEVCRQTTAACWEEATILGLVERFEARVASVSEQALSLQTVGLGDVVATIREQMRRLRAGEFVGVTTGLIDLDDLIGCLQPGQLAILAARPSVGKTALAMNAVEHAAFEAGNRVLVVTLEMNAVELGKRLASGRARVPWEKVRLGVDLTPAERRRLDGALAEMERCDRLRLSDTPVHTPASVLAVARQHRLTHGLDWLVIDYLQLLQPNADVPRKASRQEVVASISAALKRVARELEIPVLVLSQLNRQVDHREDKRPFLSDLRDSGAIEQDADLVLMLHRPDYYDPADEPGVAYLDVAKNRNGRTDRVRLSFLREFTRFENHAPDAAPPADGGPY